MEVVGRRKLGEEMRHQCRNANYIPAANEVAGRRWRHASTFMVGSRTLRPTSQPTTLINWNKVSIVRGWICPARHHGEGAVTWYAES